MIGAAGNWETVLKVPIELTEDGKQVWVALAFAGSPTAKGYDHLLKHLAIMQWGGWFKGADEIEAQEIAAVIRGEEINE